MSDQDTNTIEPDEPTTVDTDPVDDQGDPDGADQLGDPGKRALDAMKAKWQRERDQRKALADELAALKAPKAGDQPDPEAIREQARAEARAEVLRDRALDKAVAKAAGILADPEDVRVYLAGNVEDFLDGETFDLDAITAAIEDLIKSKPYLAAAPARRFQGSADGGARKGPDTPSQLTEQDLKRMTPQQIVEAQNRGQLNDLLGIT